METNSICCESGEEPAVTKANRMDSTQVGLSALALAGRQRARVTCCTSWQFDRQICVLEYVFDVYVYLLYVT